MNIPQHSCIPISPPDAVIEVVGFASSAGGLKALIEVLSDLPRDFRPPILIVQHLSPTHTSLIVPILSRRTPLHVKQAEEGDTLSSGTVYIAPPDRHLLVNPDRTLSLSHSAQVHYLRPSADLLFQSLADNFGEGATVVILSGTGSDGTLGAAAIKNSGGIVIAQDQATSEFFGMPGSVIKTGCVDYILPLGEIASALVSLEQVGEAT